MRRILLGCRIGALALVALLLIAPVPARAAGHTPAAVNRAAGNDLPAVDPDYVYNQLFYMVTSFQHREAGYDTNLPPLTNGHDEFAAYWAKEMQADLAGFGPTVTRDAFPTQGWLGRPTTQPAVNVEVTVPGLSHPEQVVIIGCHYDGEAVSTQSANDDASGCAIELGVAKAMGAYWRAHSVYPARTLRFVLYDAEEQGIFGSYHAVNATVNGDLGNIVAMFNEEQSGIGYPLRYLGKAANPVLPMYAFVSPAQSNEIYPGQDTLTMQQKATIANFRTLLAQAIPAVFAEFRALGYTSLAYRDANGNAVAEPIFTPDQTANVQLQDDTIDGSDQVPFTLAGLPCATFSGNFTYYDRNPLPWSYPYDQPQDTIQLMNTFADGRADEAPALTLSLALPGMLTTWMLAQPQILGTAAADGKPTAAISDIGATMPGKPIALNAGASYDPAGASRLSYSWSFGDGTTATGVSVMHIYAQAGTYTLTLTVTSASGSRSISKALTVTSAPLALANPIDQHQQSGRPPRNPQVTLPAPNPGLPQLPPALAAQQGSSTSHQGGSSHTGGSSGGVPHSLQVFGLLALLVLVLGGIALFLLGRRRTALARGAPIVADDASRQRRIDALRRLAESQEDEQGPSAGPPEPPSPPAR